MNTRHLGWYGLPDQPEEDRFIFFLSSYVTLPQVCQETVNDGRPAGNGAPLRPSHARPTVTIDEASSTLRLRQALVHRVSSQSEAVDVIRLLAARKSNREIADELFISVNTAANHVRAILMVHVPWSGVTR
jgi:DNA-binding NarL/FixJ family response regulator